MVPTGRTTLRDDAYQRFRDALFDEVIQPGQFLTQKELCDLTGMPLAPMREALKRLEADQLVRVLPQRGLIIAPIDRTFIQNAFQVRLFLEKEACRIFATEADEARIAALALRTRSVIQRARAGIDDALLREAYEVDWQLHNTVIADLGNDIIAEIHRVNSDRVRLIRLNRRFTARRVIPAMEEHLAIIEAFEARQPEAAATALERHLEISRKRALGDMD